jgi:hypothetical protein
MCRASLAGTGPCPANPVFRTWGWLGPGGRFGLIILSWLGSVYDCVHSRWPMAGRVWRGCWVRCRGVAGFCGRLDLAGIVDRACPVRDVALLSHGQVVEALVANRLTSPAPWCGSRTGRGRGGSMRPSASRPRRSIDDRIARALDAIAPELDRIVGSVGAQAIAAFGIDVSRCPTSGT